MIIRIEKIICPNFAERSSLMTNDRMEKYAKEVLENLKAVIYNSHFVYTSGKHGSAYLDKTAICLDPVAMKFLCHFLVQKLPDTVKEKIQVVVGPALAGIAVANTVVLTLNDFRLDAEPKIYFTWVEEDKKGEKSLRPTFQRIVKGKEVLLVDDVINTGHSLLSTIKLLEKLGARVLAVAALYNRAEYAPQLFDPIPVYSLITVKLQETYSPEECPLCRRGVPINTEFGRGKEFLKQRGKSS